MMNVISENRKAYHDFNVLERLEVGISLTGAEVKSVRAKQVSLAGSYAQVLKGELWLVGCNISKWKNACRFSVHSYDDIMRMMNKGYYAHNEMRNRKLLCHKKEILELKHMTEAKGLTVVPLKMYEKNGRIKLELGIAKGKNAVDKRETLKKNDLKREMERY